VVQGNALTKSPFQIDLKTTSKAAIYLSASLLATGLLSGCNTPTKAVESAAEMELAQEEVKVAEEKSSIIRQKSTVTQKGTHIKALVDGNPITNYDIQRRAAFLGLRRVGGNRTEKALEEMVEQTIKIKEAAIRGTLAEDVEVDAAFANFAKSNRMSVPQLAKVLGQSGVTVPHFKDFIRGQMSWSRTVTGKFRAETVSKSTSDAMFEIRQSGGDKPETYEYIMEQTIFVIPAGKSKAMLSQRRTEALAFKQGFTKCGETAAKAVGLRDVTVRSLPRSFQEQLPPEWKDELAETAEGSTTSIKNTDKGVEFIAVCSKKLVSDDSAATVVSQQKDFDSFNETGTEQADAYFEELKAKSKIIYR